MNKNTFKQIEIILNDYPNYEKYIKDLEESVLYPVRTEEENVGGGKSNLPSSPIENQVVALSEDKALRRLKVQKKAIEKVYDQADDYTQRIIKAYYFTKPRAMTWVGIARSIPMSKSQCLRYRNAFFERIADELGLMK